MSKNVQVPGVGVVSFPDDLPDDKISEVLDKQYAPPTPPEDGLTRADRDFSDKQKIFGAVPQEGIPAFTGSPSQRFGQMLSGGGSAIKSALGAGIFGAMGEPELAKGELGIPNDEPDTGVKPIEEGTLSLPRGQRIFSTAGQGLIETTPRLAAAAALSPIISPAGGAAVAFGSQPEGFDPKQAAIAAALPYVGKYFGQFTEALAGKLGISNQAAKTVINKLGGATGAAAYLKTIDESEIAKLPKDQQDEARINSWAGVASQAVLGMMGSHEQPETQEGVPDASNQQEGETGLRGGAGGRGGFDKRVSEAAGKISSALRSGNAVDLQHVFTDPSLGTEEFFRIGALLSPEEQTAVQAFGDAASRGRSISEAFKEASSVFNNKKETSESTTGIPINKNAPMSGVQKRSSEIGSSEKIENNEEVKEPQQEGDVKSTAIMTADEAAKLTPSEFVARVGNNATGEGYKLASTLDDEGRKALDAHDAAAAEEVKAAVQKISDAKTPEEQTAAFNEAQNANAKKQFFNESARMYDATKAVENGEDSKVAAEKYGVREQSIPKPTPSVPENIVSALEEQANRARQRLQERGKTTIFGSGPLHELPNILDYAIIGASKIARGTLDFAKWSGEMLNEFGEKIKPHLDLVWDHSKRIINERTVQQADTSGKSEVQKIIERNAGMTRSDLAEKLGLKIPASKVEKLTGVTPPSEEKVSVSPKAALKEVLKKSQAAGEAGRKSGAAEVKEQAKEYLEASEAATKEKIEQIRKQSRVTINDLQEKLSDSISKARALTEYLRGQEKGGAAGRKAATAEIKEADDWLEADANNIRQKLLQLVKESLPVSERGRFVTAIANATKRPPIMQGNSEAMYKRAMEVGAKIEDRAHEVAKADTIDEIKKTVEKAVASPSVDVQYKNRIVDAVKRLAFSKMSAATEARLKSTREYINKGGVDSLPDAVVSELNLLTKVPAKELPLDALEAIRDRVQLLEKLGRLKVATREALWNAEKRDLHSDMAGSDGIKLQDHPELRPQPGERASFTLKLRNLISRRLNNLATIDRGISPRDVLFDLMDGARATYRGFMSRVFGGRIDSGFNRELVRRNEIVDPVQQYGKEQGFNDQDYQRIATYAIMKQEGGRERLIANGADPAILDRIQNTIKPNELKMYDMMRKAMDSQLPEVQALMRNLYNIEVKPVDNYFPLQRDWRQFAQDAKQNPPREGEGGDVPFDELSGWKTLEQDYVPRRTTQTEKGFTQERLPDSKTPVKIHALEIFNRHIQDVSHLLETQRDLKMLGEIARHEDFAKKFGIPGQRFALDWLDTVAKQGGTEGFRRIPILDVLRRNSTLGVIGFRLASQFVHLANIPLAMNQAGPGWYLSGVKEAMSPEGQAFARKNFAETGARAGAEPAIEESAFKKLAIPAFAIVRGIDKLNSQATALGIYQRLLAEKGVNPDLYDRLPVDEAARNEALIRARRAVASPLPKDIPQALSRGAVTGGNVSVGRTLFQFQNVFLDQWSAIRHDLMRAGIQSGNAKYAAGTVAALAAMVLIETGIKYGTSQVIQSATGYKPKKPESFEKKAVIEALRRFPFMGNLLSMAMYGESGVPAIDAVSQVVKNATTAGTAKTPKARERATIQAVSGAAQIAGVPGASQAGEIIEKAQ